MKKCIYYALAVICCIASFVWLGITDQPTTAVIIVFPANLGFIALALSANKVEHRPLMTFLMLLMCLVQTAIIVLSKDLGLWMTWLGIVLPQLAMTAILLIWYLTDKTIFSGAAPIFAFLGSLIASGIFLSEFISEREIDKYKTNLPETTMVIEGIHEREDMTIVDFKKHGPYAVNEKMLINLTKGDTVLVQATNQEIFSIKRK